MIDPFQTNGYVSVHNQVIGFEVDFNPTSLPFFHFYDGVFIQKGRSRLARFPNGTPLPAIWPNRSRNSPGKT